MSICKLPYTDFGHIYLYPLFSGIQCSANFVASSARRHRMLLTPSWPALPESTVFLYISQCAMSALSEHNPPSVVSNLKPTSPS
jgi:hypothetical protein